MGQRNIHTSPIRALLSYWQKAPVTDYDKPPILLNNEQATAINAAGTGEVNLIGANASNITVLGNTSGTVASGPLTAQGSVTGKTTVTTSTTAGAVTYTIAQILGGLILRDPNGAARTDVMPTAANAVAGVVGAFVGQSFKFAIRNTADAAETITVGGSPTGVTYSGSMVIPQNQTVEFELVFTNVTASSEAYTLYNRTNGGLQERGPHVMTTVTTDSTAGAVTYTIAQIFGGLILRDPNGGNRTDVMPTAANAVAGVADAYVGRSFRFVIKNTADAAETITIGGTPTGVTYNGTLTIAQNFSREFLLVFTNVSAGTEAYTLYALSTSDH